MQGQFTYENFNGIVLLEYRGCILMIEQKKKSFREQILEICKRNSIETLTIASKQIIKCIADLVENQKPENGILLFFIPKRNTDKGVIVFA